MKKIVSALALMMACFFAKAQNEGDIVGVWLTGSGLGKVQVYKTTSGHYAGKLIWLKEPIDPDTKLPKLDKRNPDEKKRALPTLGLVNLYNFKFDADEKAWTGGKIYDPKKGKIYSCKITMKDANTLDVRGFIGISLIGRTDTWTRQKE